jgi:hypothetical protein
MPPIDTERFVDARAEAHWSLRELFESGQIDIDQFDDKLASQLGAMKWKLASKGKIRVESKEEMRKRGVPSPDRGDALMMVFAIAARVVVDVESHAGEGITGDLMTKAW